MPAATPLFDPQDFHLPPGITHVCAGGETAFLRCHDAAIARYIADKSAGPRGRDAQEAVVLSTRAQFASLWNVQDDDIGWVSNVAEGVAILLDSIHWCDGDEVCVMASEYPSLTAPGMAGAAHHGRWRFRASDAASVESLIATLTPCTRVVLVSYVSYLNGERYDLQALRQAADAVGALLVVDFTQAAGTMPIPAAIADFAFSACYKWLLGATGVAVAYWNRARQPDWVPASAGWYSLAQNVAAHPVDLQQGVALRNDALRFTRGNPAHVSLYVLASALDYLAAFEPAVIQAHVQTLTTDLLARLAKHDIASATPPDPARHGASVCLARADAQSLQTRLAAQNVLAWNGRGRLRISFHGYNCRADVERVEAALLASL